MVLVIWEEYVPDLFPLDLGRRTTSPLAAQQLSRGWCVDAGFRIMVGDFADLVPRKALVVAQLLACRKVAVAAVADEARGVVPLVLLDNVLPICGQYG